MTGARSSTAVLLLEDDMSSIRQARELVRVSCAGAGLRPRTSDTAVLLTSEVVTNALVHARSAPRLEVAVGPGSVLVEVGDDDRSRPRPVDIAPGAVSGHGLRLVDQLAADWGVRPDCSGKVVWFSLLP